MITTFTCEFFFPHALWHMAFPDQGSYPSHRCNLHCGYGKNIRSLTHCAGSGIEPTSQCSRDMADPVVPQQALLHVLILKYTNTPASARTNIRISTHEVPSHLNVQLGLRKNVLEYCSTLRKCSINITYYYSHLYPFLIFKI